MPGEHIFIGCKLPNGIVLHDPKDSTKFVTLKGTNSTEVVLYSPLPGSFAVTKVDREFWTNWKAAYMEYGPLKDGMIFEARTEQEAAEKGKERATKASGLEKLSPIAEGIKPLERD